MKNKCREDSTISPRGCSALQVCTPKKKKKKKEREEVSESEDLETTETFFFSNGTNLRESTEKLNLANGELKNHNENGHFNADQSKLTNRLNESETKDMPSSSDLNSDDEDIELFTNETSRKKFKKKSIDNSTSEELVDIKSTFTTEELTSDDEIYTFQCPANFSVEDLLNKKICFESVNEIVSSQTSEVFQLKVLGSSTFLTIALPSKKKSGCLINLPLRGKILVQKNKEIVLNDDEDFEDNGAENKIIFPEEIKIRHPLIGADWKDYIHSAEEINKKSNSLKRKNQKTKREKIKENQALKEENSFSSQENSGGKKKKIRHAKD